MANEQDEDALFDRLAKSLDAVRQDAELARAGGTEGFSASLARLEAELRSQGSGIEALRQRLEQQRAATARLDAAAARHEADTQALRQNVEALSRRVREQAEALAARPIRRRPLRLAVPAITLVVLVLAGGAAAWIASGREPTLGTISQRFVARLATLTGIDISGPAQPGRRAVALATPRAEPAPPAQPQAEAPPSAAAQAVPAPPSPVPVARTQTPAPAPPPQTEAPPAPSLPKPDVVGTAPPPLPPAAIPPAPPPVPAAAVSPTGSPAPVAAAPTPPAPPAPALRHLVLRATADSWVQVRQQSGRVLLSRVMKQGDTWAVPDHPDLLLDSGNAGALELQADGVPPTRLAGVKGVVHDVPLDADLLGAAAVPPAR